MIYESAPNSSHRASTGGVKALDSLSYTNDVVFSSRADGQTGASITSISDWLDERLRNPSSIGGLAKLQPMQPSAAQLLTNNRER